VQQDDDRAGPSDTEGAAVAVDRAELQRRRGDVPYWPEVAV
jgi:hypothetical protein